MMHRHHDTMCQIINSTNFSLSVGLQTGTSPLALPLGELSAKLTERAVCTMNRNRLP